MCRYGSLRRLVRATAPTIREAKALSPVVLWKDHSAAERADNEGR